MIHLESVFLRIMLHLAQELIESVSAEGSAFGSTGA